MNLPNKFSSVFTGNREITIDQCDNTSKLRITEVCNMLQSVAAKHSDLGGMSYSEMQKFNQAWVLSTMRVEFDTLPECHEQIEVTTWIESLPGIKSVRDFDIIHNGTKIIGASSLWVVLNTEKRRPETIALPHDHLTKYPDRKPTQLPYGRIDLTLPSINKREHTVVYSDLDLVNHVNNVKYIEWCLDTLPLSFLQTTAIKALDVNYVREVMHGETVTISVFEDTNEIYIYVKREETICFAMKLEF